MPRAQVAYSLWRATTQPSWNVPDLLTQYANVELPHLGPRAQEIVRWGIRYAGYPYIWGGEWGFETHGAVRARWPAAQRVRLLGADVVAAARRRRRRTGT